MGSGAGIPQELAGHFRLGYQASYDNAIVQNSFLWIASTMSARGEDVATTGGRTKKDKNFCPEEEEQCCRRFMHTSTDSRRRIGHKNAPIELSLVKIGLLSKT